MHYHCEIILPPSAADKIKDAVEQVLEPFDENQGPDEDGETNTSHAFWDYWVIGGRWSGVHVQQRYPQEQVDAFYAALRERKTTVSGVQWGKPSLEPASQIVDVDALWREMFPDSRLERCPLFHHSTPNNEGSLAGDVCRISELGDRASASRVIFAGPRWTDESKYCAEEMIEGMYWNGVSLIKSWWDHSIASAIKWRNEKLERAKPEYAAKHRVTDDWLAVTVDYHS